MNERKRLIVAGHARHGKDTFCELLQEISGYTFTTSSLVSSEIVFNEIGEDYGYRNPRECWEDRGNHRVEWFRIITDYNASLLRLGKKIFSDFDVYCGIRNMDEFKALKEEGLFDLSIWIDASERVPPEGKDSMKISKEDCDLVIDNNGSLEDLESKARSFCKEYL